MTESSRAVFLSYASEDAAAAKRICDALRVAGIEVWFDQSELRGGDAWDQKIRQQIRECALFVPIISAHTQARPEGYFRLEWKLAVDRSHLMAAEKAFLVPVVVDATTEPEALVPAQFRDVQWTRLRAEEVPAAFVGRITALLNQPVAHHVGSSERGVSRAPPRRLRGVLVALCVTAVVALAIGTVMRSDRLRRTRVPNVEADTATLSVAPTPAAIPEKSVAVLPFVDMSEKKNQEYFADGLSEELIDMLTKVPDLRVPARTSSFYFKGKQATIADIARALGVAHVLEGSVRKSGENLRITAQLIRADNGYHVWSESFDRRLDDIFRVQDEIATDVVRALKVSLLAGATPNAVRTANTDAYTLYLQAHSIFQLGTTAGYETALDYLRQAITLDPTFAPAWADVAKIRVRQWRQGLLPLDRAKDEAKRAAEKSLALNSRLPAAQLSMARVHYMFGWDWMAAEAYTRKAIELDPGSADAFRWAAYIAGTLGNFREALPLALRAASLDPLEPLNYEEISQLYCRIGRYVEADAAWRKSYELNPALVPDSLPGITLLARGDAAAALAMFTREPGRNWGPALAYWSLGRKAESNAALAKLIALRGDDSAMSIAEVYAYRGEADSAFIWLDRAYRQHDSDLLFIKGDLLLKNIEGDSRYKAFLRKMNLPD